MPGSLTGHWRVTVSLHKNSTAGTGSAGKGRDRSLRGRHMCKKAIGDRKKGVSQDPDQLGQRCRRHGGL